MLCCQYCSYSTCQQYCLALLHSIQTQQYFSMLLTTMNNVGSKTLLNPVELQAPNFFLCTIMLWYFSVTHVKISKLVAVYIGFLKSVNKFCSYWLFQVVGTQHVDSFQTCYNLQVRNNLWVFMHAPNIFCSSLFCCPCLTIAVVFTQEKAWQAYTQWPKNSK